MNHNIESLQAYPFTRLRQLFAGLTPPSGKPAISLGMGEPQHPAPAFVIDAIANNLEKLAKYPATAGIDELRSVIANWLCRRFDLPSVDPLTQVLPVNGTREALFAFAQTVVTPGADSLVLSPNPFYQIYEGAALLAGAQPLFLNCTEDTGFIPDFDSVSADQWQRCQLLYLCTPGNPTGAVMSIAQLQAIIELSREHNFVIASDECYSEIYADENAPPPGLLQACAAMGDTQFRNCVVFHSLSKRSNLPGLRSGFVAGDARILESFLLYRTYHGCAMPLHHQLGSVAAWSDEDHVRANRELYREKFVAVQSEFRGTIDVETPSAGFYLWPKTPLADTEFAQLLYSNENVTVLPGQYLARETDGVNPGANRVRLALVATQDECVEAAQRIVKQVRNL